MRGGRRKGPVGCRRQHNHGRLDAHAVCVKSRNLVSQMLRHQGANRYQGILDPTQCLGLLSLDKGASLVLNGAAGICINCSMHVLPEGQGALEKIYFIIWYF